MGWTLKKTDGQVFEDRSLEEIVHWAESAQINPYDELSDDGQRWRKAFEIPEFGMEWLVTLNDGTEYGPTNVPTLLEFIAVKLLGEDGTATHRESRERKPIATLLREQRERQRKATENHPAPPPAHPPSAPITFAAVFGRHAGSPAQATASHQAGTAGSGPKKGEEEVDYQIQPLPSPLEAPPPAPAGVIMPDTHIDPANDPDFIALEQEVLQAKSNYDKLLKKYEKLVQKLPKNPAAAH